MIFAHGPLGFLIAAGFHKRARKAPFRLTNREWYSMLAIGFIGGIFPDIDLFYFYFVNAATSHRQFITHTPALYIAAFAVFALATKILKKPKWFLGGAIFTLGVASHLITDGVAAKIMYLYPFSHTLYGLQNLGITAFNANALFFDFLLEGIICTIFFYTIIRWHFEPGAKRIALVAILLCVFGAGVATITIGNDHVYHDGSDSHYGDIDNDGIPNYADQDIDGDGMPNISDLDADNDGKSNPQEIIENSEQFVGAWYDQTEGGLAQIPARLGLVTNHDLLWRLYESIGMNIETDMSADYAVNQTGYISGPSSTNFDRDPQNIKTWLQHINRLQTDLAQGRYQIGDMLFFADDYVSVVTGFTNEGVPLVLDVYHNRPITQKTLAEVITLQGPVQARGKMLDARPLGSQ